MFSPVKYVDVILPLALPRLYTYAVPKELENEIMVGQRVVVQFASQKIYTAIIHSIHENKPSEYEVKAIDSILDESPIVTEKQLVLWTWMANYYLCTLGEVMQAAMPSSLKLASETNIIIHPDFDGSIDELNDQELAIVEALQVRDKLTVKEVIEILNKKTVLPLIKILTHKKVITTEEELKHRYKPKVENFVKLTENYSDEAKLQKFFDVAEKKAPKQSEALMQYLHLSGILTTSPIELKKSKLVEAIGGPASIDALVKKGVLELYAKRTDRMYLLNTDEQTPKALNDIQAEALQEIKNHFTENKTTLLHGITGSGKTEIYIHLIEEVLNQGKQVLYLLPEIALTAQIISRIKIHFGNKVGIYHSKYNENERAEVWERVNSSNENSFDIIIGARSSVFLPYRDLGLVIVDEEHESSYKQFDPAPRYQARDTAIILASHFKANILLGSATPSIETYHQATNGKYGYVQINKRFGGVMLPEIQVVDLKKAKKEKKVHDAFSETLLDEVKAAIGRKEQIILFQNRRGYTPQWNCELCGWVPRCNHCDVSLTYHKFSHYLTCHYCGLNYTPPTRCEACGSTHLKMIGLGTEKIEEELNLLLPDVICARMDLDTTRSKNAYYQIISDFEERKIDILIGTQMISKGLDFDNVSLVGILHADPMLNFPDFRAFEKAYQLFTQVSGRAGRKNKRGKVLIQAQTPDHWVIQKVMQNDYEGMVRQELLERKNFHYPPYVKLIRITLKHRNQERVHQSAIILANWLKEKLGERVLGPDKPAIGRIKDQHLRSIMIKIERGSKFNDFKQFVQDKLDQFSADQSLRSVRVDCDVDPY